MLAITGQTYHDLIGTRYQQEVDLLSLFKDVAVYNQQVLGAGHVRALVDAGCRAALSLGGVAHITCPVDLQEQAVKDDEPSQKKIEGHTSDAWRPPTVVPCDGDIRAAADLLNAGTKTVILAGHGALGAGAELEQLADLHGRAHRQTAARQGAWCPTTRRSRLEGLDCSAPSHPRSPWKSATRC